MGGWGRWGWTGVAGRKEGRSSFKGGKGTRRENEETQGDEDGRGGVGGGGGSGSGKANTPKQVSESQTDRQNTLRMAAGVRNTFTGRHTGGQRTAGGGGHSNLCYLSLLFRFYCNPQWPAKYVLLNGAMKLFLTV